MRVLYCDRPTLMWLRHNICTRVIHDCIKTKINIFAYLVPTLLLLLLYSQIERNTDDE